MTNWSAANLVTWFFDATKVFQNTVENTKSGYIYKTAYGRTLVCLYVMGDRGLIRVERDQLHLCRPENKVDLEQAAMMRQLRLFLQEE